MRHLSTISMEECTLPDKCQATIGCLEEFRQQHPPILDIHFQEMKVVAGELRGERGLRQWSFAWSKCQETKKVFDRKMEVALRARDSAHRLCSDSAPAQKSLPGLWGGSETSSLLSYGGLEDASTSIFPPHTSSSKLPTISTPAPASSPVTPQRTPLLQRLFRRASTVEPSERREICSYSPSLPHLGPSSSSSSRRQQLRKTQSFDAPSTPEVLRYGPCPRSRGESRGNTGVFIRGLEVSSTEAADHTLCPRTPAHGWAGQGLCSPGTTGTPTSTDSPTVDPRPRGRWVLRVSLRER